MKAAEQGCSWFFVDEAGDTTFFDRRGRLIVGEEGCSPILILGYVRADQPTEIRRRMLDLQREVLSNSYFENVPSLQKTAVAFHAKDDLPEIRYLVYRLLAELDFQAQLVVARKTKPTVSRNYGRKPRALYDDLVQRLFTNTLHKTEQNQIIFAKRGSRTRQEPLESAIRRGVRHFEEKWNTEVSTDVNISVQRPSGEPMLSVVDYVNWAVYRAFTRGEMRYFNSIRDRVSLLADLHDTVRYPGNWYNKKNAFDIKKITPL